MLYSVLKQLLEAKTKNCRTALNVCLCANEIYFNHGDTPYFSKVQNRKKKIIYTLINVVSEEKEFITSQKGVFVRTISNNKRVR